ncbi:MAG TPA: GTP cyclohydrolase MptA [Synergistaceae bacterium]|nr:GTP cyclohydrolase MptA [Synergistaceae bacterium]
MHRESPGGKSLPGLVYLGLGSNLGNPRENLLQALQYLEIRGKVRRLSSFYETDPVGYENQPPFCNAVCAYRTGDSPRRLLEFLKWIEKRMGRTPTFRNGPRVVDLDILLWEGRTLKEENLEIPHPRMHQRAFVLVPFKEIAPRAWHPGEQKTIADLQASVDSRGVRLLPRELSFPLAKDVQQEAPEIPLALSRVGVKGIRRLIRLESPGCSLFDASMDLFVHLPSCRSGVHMSRFTQDLEEFAQEIASERVPDLETLAEHMALRIAQSQKSALSEVRLRVNYPFHKRTPISGKDVEELYAFLGYAASDGTSVRRAVGVEVDGFTACPCARSMIEDYARYLLEKEGYSPEESARIAGILPLASHNQRGRGTLLVGTRTKIGAEQMVHLVEASMSSEIYGLLKRPDEFFVVRKGHERPRFVEDVVREMAGNLLELFPELEEEDFVLFRQENFESIHKHNAFAERSALVGDLRQELSSGISGGLSRSLEAWLLDFSGKERA